MSTETNSLADRLKQLESLPGAFVRRQPKLDATPHVEPPAPRIPAPRRSRVFLRGGEGFGVFADLTLTAPITRSYLT